MTQLDIQEDSINHKFIPGFWLPTNVLPQELYLPLYRTDFIEELPPYLMVSGMSTIPYRIIDSTHTAMALPVVRDQAPPYLLEEGSLMIGPYRYLHSTAIPPLANEELLETDSENLSLWRRVTEHGALACTIPQGGRIVVLSPDFTTLVDTLYTPRQQLEIEVYGSYIAFIGIEGTRFEPTFRRFE
ncbi:MAG: hypothetical protein LRY50_16870 [Geovibrio sp.]|nr:hypothetical protein [Geovibrio sp.]